MKSKTRLFESLLTVLILLFLAAPLAADAGSAAPAPETPEEVTQARPSGLCAPAVPEAEWLLPDIGAQSTCVADCWDGTTRTCNGSSCTAVDSACSQGENGYCWSDEEGRKDCPVCETTCPWPSCDELNGQSCGKFGSTCYGPPPTCQAYTCNCWDGQLICP